MLKLNLSQVSLEIIWMTILLECIITRFVLEYIIFSITCKETGKDSLQYYLLCVMLSGAHNAVPMYNIK